MKGINQENLILEYLDDIIDEVEHGKDGMI